MHAHAVFISGIDLIQWVWLQGKQPIFIYIYVAMVMPILYDNPYSQMTQISNMSYLKKIIKLWHLSIEFYHKWQSPF